MRCLLAAFDQAHLADDGTYWTWRHPELPLRLLDTLYYDIAAKNLHDRLDDSRAEKFIGGWAGVDSEWLCWYRFLEGGRDKSARHGRTILLTVFVQRSAAPADWSGIWNTPQLIEILKQAARCPLPRPDSLELAFEPTRVEPNALGAVKLIKERSLIVEGAAATLEAVCATSGLPPELAFDAVTSLNDRGNRVRICLVGANASSDPITDTTNGNPIKIGSPASRQIAPTSSSHSSIGAIVRWFRLEILGQPIALLAGVIVGLALGQFVHIYGPQFLKPATTPTVDAELQRVRQ